MLIIPSLWILILNFLSRLANRRNCHHRIGETPKTNLSPKTIHSVFRRTRLGRIPASSMAGAVGSSLELAGLLSTISVSFETVRVKHRLWVRAMSDLAGRWYLSSPPPSNHPRAPFKSQGATPLTSSSRYYLHYFPGPTASLGVYISNIFPVSSLARPPLGPKMSLWWLAVLSVTTGYMIVSMLILYILQHLVQSKEFSSCSESSSKDVANLSICYAKRRS